MKSISDLTRRDFIRATGVTAAGLAASTLLDGEISTARRWMGFSDHLAGPSVAPKRMRFPYDPWTSSRS